MAQPPHGVDNTQRARLESTNHLYLGERQRFLALIDHYFRDGMERLAANAAKAPEVIAKVTDLIDDADCRITAAALDEQWAAWEPLHQAWQTYQNGDNARNTDTHNTTQRELATPFADYFAGLHQHQKALDKAIRAWERQQAEANGGKRQQSRDLKALKSAMDDLRADMSDAESRFQHIDWLQSRFPDARYEDVVGLCKAASREEIEEQDWSLNPGRYVGVVIEEDGKTEKRKKSLRRS